MRSGRKNDIEQEKKEYDQKIKQRKLKEEKTGKKTRGRKPQEPKEEPNDKDQYNFTDPESRVMKTGGGFDQCYNAQAGVDHDSRLIVGQSLSDRPNDQKELVKTVDSIPGEVGTPEKGCSRTVDSLYIIISRTSFILNLTVPDSSMLRQHQVG